MTDPRGATDEEHGLRRPSEPDESDDWFSSDRLDAVGWAAIFLWGAAVVLASYAEFTNDYDWWDGWGVFFVGAGIIVLIEAAIRFFVPSYRSKLAWTFVWGVVFLSIGLSTLYSSAWLALALVAAAVAILAGAFRPRST